MVDADEDATAPARIVVRRALDWMDTDAAGIWHWTAAFRHLEAAEHALHEALGIAELTFGSSPRVRVEVDFRSPVAFGDVVASSLAVESVGRSSITYGVRLRVGDRVAAAGRLVTVIVGDDGAAVAVPAVVRQRLHCAGAVLPRGPALPGPRDWAPT